MKTQELEEEKAKLGQLADDKDDEIAELTQKVQKLEETVNLCIFYFLVIIVTSNIKIIGKFFAFAQSYLNNQTYEKMFSFLNL